jgi:hypothetical protein
MPPTAIAILCNVWLAVVMMYWDLKVLMSKAPDGFTGAGGI